MKQSESIPQNVVQLPYKDRPEIAEIHVDQSRMTHFDGYAVRIELVVVRPHWVPEKQAVDLSFVPCARLALSPQAAVNLHGQLSNVLSGLEQAGVLKRSAPSSQTAQ